MSLSEAPPLLVSRLSPCSLIPLVSLFTSARGGGCQRLVVIGSRGGSPPVLLYNSGGAVVIWLLTAGPPACQQQRNLNRPRGSKAIRERRLGFSSESSDCFLSSDG